MTTVQIGPQVRSEAKSLGDRVTELRKAAGYSVAQLHKLSGISEATIHHLEKGRQKMIDPPVMRVLAASLGTEVWDLLIAAGYLDPGPVLAGVDPELISAAKGRSKDSQRKAAAVLRVMQ